MLRLSTAHSIDTDCIKIEEEKQSKDPRMVSKKSQIADGPLVGKRRTSRLPSRLAKAGYDKLSKQSKADLFDQIIPEILNLARQCKQEIANNKQNDGNLRTKYDYQLPSSFDDGTLFLVEQSATKVHTICNRLCHIATNVLVECHQSIMKQGDYSVVTAKNLSVWKNEISVQWETVMKVKTDHWYGKNVKFGQLILSHYETSRKNANPQHRFQDPLPRNSTFEGLLADNFPSAASEFDKLLNETITEIGSPQSRSSSQKRRTNYDAIMNPENDEHESNRIAPIKDIPLSVAFVVVSLLMRMSTERIFTGRHPLYNSADDDYFDLNLLTKDYAECMMSWPHYIVYSPVPGNGLQCKVSDFKLPLKHRTEQGARQLLLVLVCFHEYRIHIIMGKYTIGKSQDYGSWGNNGRICKEG